MRSTDKVRGSGSHPNAFGFLRLVFASLVIVSHVPEVVDGNSQRELLTQAFGTITFGELAVDCFFIISGFLISASYLASSSVGSYIIKRVARIYPAFIIASLLCVLVVAPLGGADLQSTSLTFYLKAIGHSLTLNPPDNPGAFVGTHYDGLNNSMWTIRYEFRCYLLVVPLGLVGLLRRPALLGATAVVLISFSSWASHAPDLAPRWVHLPLWFGTPADSLKLTGMFLAGATFRGIQDSLPLKPRYIAVAVVMLIGSLFIPPFARLGVASAGAYIIFSTAAAGKNTVLALINNDNDVSYGLYLYAWPIEKLLIAWGLVSPLWLLGLSVWLVALMMGAISWFLIEKPALVLTKKLIRQPSALRRDMT
jgi:peptidoglycan/LPS O-acetylase OafA/YrhL